MAPLLPSLLAANLPGAGASISSFLASEVIVKNLGATVPGACIYLRFPSRVGHDSRAIWGVFGCWRLAHTRTGCLGCTEFVACMVLKAAMGLAEEERPDWPFPHSEAPEGSVARGCTCWEAWETGHFGHNSPLHSTHRPNPHSLTTPSLPSMAGSAPPLCRPNPCPSTLVLTSGGSPTLRRGASNPGIWRGC